MEFGCGRSDDPYREEVEEEEEEEEEDSSNKHNMLSMTSTCSSSSSFHLHQLPLPPTSSAPSSSNTEALAMAATEKEHMFDKVVTPSDVGKLNRLVIPKQHAEKHFPLDPSVDEKGLLLSFEDRTGKKWQFRYSYWKSSQSYVMTKGWSRFVKDKRLDAGDTVSFYRGAGGHFVDWKRKPVIHGPSRLLLQPRVTFPDTASTSNYPMVSFSRTAGLPWAGRIVLPTPPPAAAATSYDPRHRYSYGYSNAASGSSAGAQYLVFGSAAATATPIAARPMVLDSVVHSQQLTTARRVRLFGVDLDLQESDRQHPYERPPPLQLQQQQQQQQAFSSSSSSPSSTANEQQQQSLDLDL